MGDHPEDESGLSKFASQSKTSVDCSWSWPENKLIAVDVFSKILSLICQDTINDLGVMPRLSFGIGPVFLESKIVPREREGRNHAVTVCVCLSARTTDLATWSIAKKRPSIWWSLPVSSERMCLCLRSRAR